MVNILLLLILTKQSNAFNTSAIFSALSNILRVKVEDKRPDSFDWNEKRHVSPVKNQKNCNASWAFSVVANIESHLSIHTKNRVVLSEQFLIDCDDEQNGCEYPGSLLTAFVNIVTVFKGVIREKQYFPFEEQKNSCRWKERDGPAPQPVYGFVRVPNNENIMADIIWKHGPLSAMINSNSLQKYEGDDKIDYPKRRDCDVNERDQAVLIVGFDVYIENKDRKLPYWIIKNSWGVTWGNKGYYKLIRGINACGIAQEVFYPTVSF